MDTNSNSRKRHNHDGKQRPIIKKPDYIEDIDEVVTKMTGAPFARNSQTLFTGAPIKPNDIRIDVSASSCPVVTIKAKENRWLNTWAISYYLYNLINRYDAIDELDLIIPYDIKEKFGYTSIKLLAERGTKVKLLTSSSIKDTYFSEESIHSLTIKDTKQYQGLTPLPQLGYTILINGKEVHAEKLAKNIYSDDPIVISDIQSDFNTLWNIDKKKDENK